MAGPRFDFTLKPTPRATVLYFAHGRNGNSERRRDHFERLLPATLAYQENVRLGEPGHHVLAAAHSGSVVQHVGLVLGRGGPAEMVLRHTTICPIAARVSRLVSVGRRGAVRGLADASRNQHRAACRGFDHGVASRISGEWPDQALGTIVGQHHLAVIPLGSTVRRPSTKSGSVPHQPLVVGTAATSSNESLAAPFDRTYPLGSQFRSSVDRVVRARRNVSSIRRVRYFYPRRSAPAIGGAA